MEITIKFGGVIGASGKWIDLIKHREMPIQEKIRSYLKKKFYANFEYYW